MIILIKIIIILILLNIRKLSELGLESSYKGTIDKETKTKEEKYLSNKVFNIQIHPDDSARLNVT